jgi:solute carrier family 25 (mitochondrial S-adenosylmethionine transporter), member 26
MVLRRALTGSTGMSGVMHSTDSATVTSSVPPPPPPMPPQPDAKPAHDVVAGAVARAASQSTIHPLDTMKVRMQAGSPRRAPKVPRPTGHSTLALRRGLHEVGGLYKGVVGAATGAGIIIGTYFAFYSTSKRFLKEHTSLHDGSTAFVAGGVAAMGSSVVKVPLAVCIRSVQAGVYRNVLHAARSIVAAAGVRGLFTGFVPTILEDVPDMAVKFAVYETLRKVHTQMSGGKPANVAEDLIMGGFAGAAAAAATTPLDVVKTVMMCSASSRPTLVGAVRSVMREGRGVAPFFRGVGPRALSNGLNSAIFFCFFEAIRQVLIKRQQQNQLLQAASVGVARSERRPLFASKQRQLAEQHRHNLESKAQPRPVGSAAACLSLALPVAGPWED